jgi:putative ABC transport system ATP-binding protein
MAEATGPVVIGRDVWRIYPSPTGPVEALRGVNLEIPRGGMVSVMGPSGSGKTTFLNCFSGLDKIDRGSILIDGRDLQLMVDNEKSRYRAQRMGFIFQSYNLLPVLSSVENVELPLLVGGVPVPEARRRALRWLEELGVGAKAFDKPNSLSGGQQQRVAVARALAPEPAIVWADEPTGNLDGENAHQVMSLLQEMNRAHHQTLIVVTHNPEIARQCAIHYRMHGGELLAG